MLVWRQPPVAQRHRSDRRECLCQQWIQEHGNNDVIDYLMMHSSRTSINKQTVINKSAVNKNTPTQKNSVIDQADDINDDFTKL